MRMKENNIGIEGMIVKVFCEVCDDWINELNVKTTNIEEDYEGRDILSFDCPECDHHQKSFRVLGY